MDIFKLDEFLKEKFKKTPRLKNEFDRLVLSYFYGDFSDFNEIYELIDNDDNDYINLNEIINFEISKDDINYIENILNKYFKNRNLFKNINLTLNSYDEKYGKGHQFISLEDLDDHMTYEIEKSKILKYQNSFLKSYKNLANEETFEIFREIINKNINREIINKNISKIKVFNTEDLNSSLKSIINSDSLDTFLKKIENKNIEVLSSDNNILIIEINDYDASKFIGSKQWCISYDDKYWYSYKYEKTDRNEFLEIFPKMVKNSENKIFFIIDFNKDQIESNYMIAITTLPSGKFIFANDKNDKDILNDIKDNEYLKNIISDYLYLDNNNELLDFNNFKIFNKKIHGVLNYIKFNSKDPLFDLINFEKKENLSYSDYIVISYFINDFLDLNITKKNIKNNNKYFEGVLQILDKTGNGFNSDIINKILNDKQNDYSNYHNIIEDSIIYEIDEGNIKLTDEILFFVAKFNINGSFVSNNMIDLINEKNNEDLILFLSKNRNQILKDEFFNNLIFNISYFDNNKSKIIFDYFEKNVEKIYFNKNNKKSIQYLLNIADSVFFENNINDYPKIKECMINKIDYESCYFFKKDKKEYKIEKSIISKINNLINLKIIDEKKLNILFNNLLNDKNFNFSDLDKKELNCLKENKEDIILLLRNKYTKSKKRNNYNI